MRWKALYLILAFAVVAGLIYGLFFNRIVEWSLERSLETAVGTRAEIDRVRFDLRRLNLKIEGLRIANPRNTWRNLIDLRDLRCQFAGSPLYEGKIVIEEAAIDGLRLNTPRRTSGKIKRRLLPGPLGKAQAKLNADIASIPLLDLGLDAIKFDTGKLWPSYTFTVGREAEALRAKIEMVKQVWQADTLKVAEAKTKVGELQPQITAIVAAKPSSVLEIKEFLTSLDQLQKNVAGITNTVGGIRTDFQTSVSAVSTGIKSLADSAKQDFQTLRQLAKLPDFQSFSVSEALFGKAFLQESAVFVNLADQLQAYIPVQAASIQKPSHPRAGSNIAFPGRAGWPRLLIKSLKISGGTPDHTRQGFWAQGGLTGFTTEPAVYGRPMLAQLSAVTADKLRLDFAGRIDQTRPDYRDEFQLKLAGMALPELALPESPFLPAKIGSGEGEADFALVLRPGFFAFDLGLTGRNIIGDYAGKAPPGKFMEKIIRECLGRIDELKIDFHLEKGRGPMRMRLRSNLDEIILAKVRSLIGAEVERVTSEIRARVDAELQARQAQLEALKAETQARLEANLAQAQAMVDQAKAQVEAEKAKLNAQMNTLVEQGKSNLQNQLEQAVQGALPKLPQLPTFPK